MFASIVVSLWILTSAHGEDWTSTDGATYRNVAVLRHDSTTVTITFDGGGATLPLDVFSEDIQMRYGFDAKAAADAKARAAEDETRLRLRAAEDLKRKQQEAEAKAAELLQLQHQAEEERDEAIAKEKQETQAAKDAMEAQATKDAENRQAYADSVQQQAIKEANEKAQMKAKEDADALAANNAAARTKALLLLIILPLYAWGMVVYARSRTSRSEPGILFWMVNPCIMILLCFAFLASDEPPEKALTIEEQVRLEHQKENEEFDNQLQKISQDPKVLNKLNDIKDDNDDSGRL